MENSEMFHLKLQLHSEGGEVTLPQEVSNPTPTPTEPPAQETRTATQEK